MQDTKYIANTIRKLEGALVLHRAQEYRILVETAEKNGMKVEPSGDATDKFILWLHTDGGRKGAIVRGFKVVDYGKGREGDKGNVIYAVYLDGKTLKKLIKTMDLLEADDIAIAQIEKFMTRNDINTVKRLLVELKPFMTLVEKDRQAAKEERHAEWRHTYEECIRLYGDIARG